MTSKKKSTSRLGNCFVGEIVIFYMKGLPVATVSEDGEQIQISSMVDGYVIDIDDEYFYIGDEEGNIHRAIERNSVAIAEIAKTGTINEMINNSTPKLSDDDGEFH